MDFPERELDQIILRLFYLDPKHVNAFRNEMLQDGKTVRSSNGQALLHMTLHITIFDFLKSSKI